MKQRFAPFVDNVTLLGGGELAARPVSELRPEPLPVPSLKKRTICRTSSSGLSFETNVYESSMERKRPSGNSAAQATKTGP